MDEHDARFECWKLEVLPFTGELIFLPGRQYLDCTMIDLLKYAFKLFLFTLTLDNY